jgi:hypothetical protein
MGVFLALKISSLSTGSSGVSYPSSSFWVATMVDTTSIDGRSVRFDAAQLDIRIRSSSRMKRAKSAGASDVASERIVLAGPPMYVVRSSAAWLSVNSGAFRGLTPL